MSQYSDSESRDSDEGIRFKTDSVRSRQDKNLSSSRSERSRSRSPRSRRKEDDSCPTDAVLGPQLPSHLQKRCNEASSFGPLLPPHLKKEDTESFGPQLPPQLHKKNVGPRLVQKETIGPQLPPNLLNKEEIEEKPSSYIGPQLPPHLRQILQENAAAEESDEEDTYGPLPVGASSFSRAQLALEERALQLKMDQLEPNKDKPPSREEWMLELPEVKAARFGLGPRQFRSKAGPDMSDRSSWTDTPDKKKQKKEEKKVDLKKETELKEIRKRDEQQEKIAKKLKKKNKESLLEIHQSKIKKKKQEEPTERRPFSRETDLQVNRFDEAQKKAVLKKAQLLDDRFSSGQSKFL